MNFVADDISGPPPAGTLRVTVTSLEMAARPDWAHSEEGLQPGARVERVVRPGVPFYRFLYDTVGEPWLWADRRRWSDGALAARVQHPDVEIWLLTADGQPAGFGELDRRIPDEVELSYFGLLPAFIGRGLGPQLLRFVVRQAWDATTRRLWVHTCDLDHPSALGHYRRVGFLPFRTDVVIEQDPRATGLFPRSAAPHRPMTAAPAPFHRRLGARPTS